jgi:tetratricopeptide (TPR) repeat protein
MQKHKSLLSERPALSVLQYWTQNVELDVTAGRFEDAFLTLSEVSGAFMVSAYPREFARAARDLLRSVNWTSDHNRYNGFEAVFGVQISILSDLGECREVDSLLDQYELTVPERDARYINYCDRRCYSLWARGDFSAAVKWGEIGENLRMSSDVDTKYRVTHSLALAERDAGQPESALPIFLDGRAQSEVIDPEELDEIRPGDHYGNIGRCLHLMGQVEGALVCYQKSALLIEKDPKWEHVLNQGFVRQWIGELLVARSQFRLAGVFFRAAHQKWEHVSPPRAAKAKLLSQEIELRISREPSTENRDVELICLDWIMGRSIDAQFR